MKTKFFSAAMMVAALLLPSCGSAQKGYVIKGDVEGLEGKIYLSKSQSLKGDVLPVDSAVVTGGKFEFRGAPVEETQIMYLLIDNDALKSNYRPVFLNDGTITVKGTLEDFFYTTVGGTANNEAMTEYMFAVKPINDSLFRIMSEAEKVWNSGDTTKGDYYGELFMGQRDLFPVIRKEAFERSKGTEFSVYLLASQTSGSSTVGKIDSLISHVPAELMDSPFAKEMIELRDALGAVDPGVLAPDFTLPDPDGKMISLSSSRGQYVLLDFWASWCGPCRGEIPHLKKMYGKYRDAGFEIFSVSLDNKRDAWMKALNEEDMLWIQVSDLEGMKSQPAVDYSVSGIPAMWLLDKDGVIIAKDVRGAKLEAELEKIFGF